MSKNLTAHLSVLAANVLYGANYAIAKKLMPEYIAPYGFIMVRVFFASILFFIAGIFIKEKIEKKHYGRLVFCSLFGVAINQLLFFKGLSLTTPVNASLMMTLNPIMVLVLSSFILKEKISNMKIIGIAVGIAGASLLILSGKEFSLSTDTVSGDIMVFLNSLSFALFLIIVNPLMKIYHPITIIKWCFLYGTFMVMPFGLQESLEARWSDLDLNLWLGVLYVVIGTTFLAYYLNINGLRRLSPSVVSFYIYLQPVFATLFSWVLQQGKPNVMHLFSAVLIFFGVYLVSKNNKKTEIISYKKN